MEISFFINKRLIFKENQIKTAQIKLLEKIYS